jgi:hypothetical protein
LTGGAHRDQVTRRGCRDRLPGEDVAEPPPIVQRAGQADRLGEVRPGQLLQSWKNVPRSESKAKTIQHLHYSTSVQPASWITSSAVRNDRDKSLPQSWRFLRFSAVVAAKSARHGVSRWYARGYKITRVPQARSPASAVAPRDFECAPPRAREEKKKKKRREEKMRGNPAANPDGR